MAYQVNFQIDDRIANKINENARRYHLSKSAYCRMLVAIFAERSHTVTVEFDEGVLNYAEKLHEHSRIMEEVVTGLAYIRDGDPQWMEGAIYELNEALNEALKISTMSDTQRKVLYSIKNDGLPPTEQYTRHDAGTFSAFLEFYNQRVTSMGTIGKDEKEDWYND